MRIVKGGCGLSSAEDTVVRNQALQVEWYGEPLGARFRRVLDRLGLPQSGLAAVLGLSAPMLSQLMSGQRAKIGNPAVLSRLLAVEELIADPGFGELPKSEIKRHLERIRGESAATTTGARVTATGRGSAESPVAALQSLLRSVASAAEIESAAGKIDGDLPELAELLRVIGNGRTSEAEAHYRRVLGR
ncbi:hypothetical protein [Spirillospora sp. CA-294931]|uniref:hypothetical protein n=1 Tax=Spirillospora sp. CA-294931 TaxID=3240042 RepID=UPI003D93DB60